MQVEAVAERFRRQTVWTCDKWSEEAVEFARKKADQLGITHCVGHLKMLKDGSVVPQLTPIKHGVSSAMLRALVGSPEESVQIAGNLLLNEGIQRLLDMSMIATVTSNQVAGNPWSNGNAFTGVGDSATAEAATQTDLQAASNHFYKAMNATFPSRSSQTVTFASDFTTAEANYVWNEWTISAGATSASGSGFLIGTTNLNRKVASLGTKASGTWTLTTTIAFS
jgi:hypothetical protein